MPSRLEGTLHPGETILYRAGPAWPAVALVLVGGLGILASMHLWIGILDDNWYCGASLFGLVLWSPWGAKMLFNAGKSETLITDQRILHRKRWRFCRSNASNGVEELMRSEVDQVELVAQELSIAAVRVTSREEKELTLKLLQDPGKFRDLLLDQETVPFEQRETIGGTLLVVFGIICAAFGAFTGFFGGFALLYSMIPDPWLEMLRNWNDIYVALLIYAIVALFMAPWVAMGILGACLGYLPSLALSRLIVPFEEARVMALYPGRRVKILQDSEDRNFISRWFEFWLLPAARACSWSAEKLVSYLFQETVEAEERAAA